MQADWGDHQRGFRKRGRWKLSFLSESYRKGRSEETSSPTTTTHTHNVSRTAQPDGALVPRKSISPRPPSSSPPPLPR